MFRSCFDRPVARRKRFEGEHPLNCWTRASAREFPRIGYAPSEYRTKPWPIEALIEGWFPLSRRGQCGFKVLSTVDLHRSFFPSRVPGACRCSPSTAERLGQPSRHERGGTPDARANRASPGERGSCLLTSSSIEEGFKLRGAMRPECLIRSTCRLLPPGCGHLVVVSLVLRSGAAPLGE